MPTLADTSLTPKERLLLERFAALLRERLGEELHAVWLYGSRARGEQPDHEESDVDVLVLVEDASWDGRRTIRAALWDAAQEPDLESVASWVSIHAHTTGWVQSRRAIRSFFMAEVDRDKVVIEGSP